MRRRANKLRQFSLGGAKANSTYIGSELKKYFVVGDSANNVRLFTFEHDEEIETYSSHNNQNVQTQVTAVALSFLENQIFSGSNRGMISVWDMQTAKLSFQLRGHSTSINCFGIYPEQQDRLASGSYDSTVKLWDIREKNSTATLKGHAKQVNAVAFSPDGNMLLSGSQDHSNRLWDLRNFQRPIFSSNEHNGPIIRARFNPQDCFFATSSMDKTVKYFRCEQKCFGFASSTQMIATPVTGLCFSNDGKILYAAANDGLKSYSMFKNGLLLQTFQANWKGVQDMTMRQQILTAVSFSGNNLTLWVCDVNGKIKNSSRLSEESSFVLPKINRGGIEKGDYNFSELQNIVGMAVEKVNNIEEKPTRDKDERKEELQRKKLEELEKKRQEYQRRKEQMERKKKEEQKRQKQLQIQRQKQKQRLLLEKLIKQKEEKEKKEQQRLRKLQQEKMQQQRLYQERLQREKAIQQKVKETFQNQNSFQNSGQDDMLEGSTLMRLSNYLSDGNQKEKMKQLQMIEQIVKEKTKFQSFLIDKSTSIRPILSYWKNGKLQPALQLLQKSNYIVKLQCTTAILNTPIFKQGISPENAVKLTSIMNNQMVNQKNSTFVRGAMENINAIVLLFKDQLIKIKTFNPMTRVDLSRQQRLAKYDRLIDQFLNVFRQQRLKRYSQKRKLGDENALCNSAFVLYKNLEEVLIKILPKQEPQLA